MVQTDGAAVDNEATDCRTAVNGVALMFGDRQFDRAPAAAEIGECD